MACSNHPDAPSFRHTSGREVCDACRRKYLRLRGGPVYATRRLDSVESLRALVACLGCRAIPEQVGSVVVTLHKAECPVQWIKETDE